MKATISDVHDSHGAEFTLNLPKSVFSRKTFVALKRLLKYAASHNSDVSLYSYRVNIDNDNISIDLAESSRVLAKVDFRWNSSREDQKYMVLIAEDDSRNEENVEVAKHYICHLCKHETWGVDRDTMEIYDLETVSIRLVSVHRECKEDKLKNIERDRDLRELNV